MQKFMVYNIQVFDGTVDGFYCIETDSLDKVLESYDDENGRFVPLVHLYEGDFPYGITGEVVYDGFECC